MISMLAVIVDVFGKIRFQRCVNGGSKRSNSLPCLQLTRDSYAHLSTLCQPVKNMVRCSDALVAQTTKADLFP